MIDNLNTSMKRVTRGILRRCFPVKELAYDYFDIADGYVISDKRDVYKIDKDDGTNDYDIAALMFVEHNTQRILILCTDVQFRHQGYAKELLSTVCTLYDKLTLNVRVSNENAIKLYESVGFKRKDVLLKNYYSYTGINEDAYEYDYLI